MSISEQPSKTTLPGHPTSCPAVNSYGQIIRSSSILGGATGINYVIGMVRTKAVALLLGPSGVGLVGLYVSITALVSTIAQLGINQSGVREVAEAHGRRDPEGVARVVKTLRRMCWLTGILGWIITVVLAWPLSQWTFGSPDRIWPITILGVTVLIAAVTGGQTALLQGMRRIGDLARIQVISAIVTTLVAVGLYAWLGENGILPVIILTSSVQLVLSWYFSRCIKISNVTQSWAETFENSKSLIGLGSAFMYGAVLTAIVGLAIRGIIVRDLGLDANGIYQAAWSISGMFAGFILGAMGTDFYPRLTAVASDNSEVNRLVNEQIEIGILLALPGMIGTLAFAPLIMEIMYSKQFLAGASLLPWFLIGVFGQVMSWPLGMILMAKGATKSIYLTRTIGNALCFFLTLALIPRFGILGASVAFAAYIWIQYGLVYLVARKASHFQCSPCIARLWAAATVLAITCFALTHISNEMVKFISCSLLTGVSCIYSLRCISNRLGENHRIVQLVKKVVVN